MRVKPHIMKRPEKWKRLDRDKREGLFDDDDDDGGAAALIPQIGRTQPTVNIRFVVQY